jgi:hypothetical protein
MMGILQLAVGRGITIPARSIENAGIKSFPLFYTNLPQQIANKVSSNVKAPVSCNFVPYVDSQIIYNQLVERLGENILSLGRPISPVTLVSHHFL